jgi:hypothetical protein
VAAPTFWLAFSARRHADAAIAVPDNVRSAAAPQVRVASQKLADGVWFIGGGSHNSLAVEFKDFVTVIEGPYDMELYGGVRRYSPATSTYTHPSRRRGDLPL